MTRPPLLGVALALGLAVTGCADPSSDAADLPEQGCDAEVQERIDPDHLVHLLPGADEPRYLSDPPTSGPHAPTAPHGGVEDEPLGRAEQVGLLEAGVVLVQHRDLADGAVADLQGLADPADVLVVPNDSLPVPIVVTAWTRKLLCRSLDGGGRAAVATFIEARAGRGPGTDG